MNTLEIQSSLEHVLKIAKVFNKRSSRAGDLDEPKSNVTQTEGLHLNVEQFISFLKETNYNVIMNFYINKEARLLWILIRLQVFQHLWVKVLLEL